MDPLAIIKDYGAVAVIVYLFIEKVFPRMWPDYIKVIGKRISNEDRLFKLFEDNSINSVRLAETMIKLQSSIDGLAVTLVALDQRVDRLEHTFADSDFNTFMKWFKRLKIYTDLQASEHSILEK